MRSSLFGEAKESVKGLKYFAQRNEVRVNFTHGYIFFSTFLLVQFASFCIVSAKILFCSGGSKGDPMEQNFLNFIQFLGTSGKFVWLAPPSTGNPGSAPVLGNFFG